MPPPQRVTRTKDSIEDRRARGEISCAECRRHKLKCDRNIPCSTCVRKGCQSICPNGTLAPPSTSRTNETDTDTLKTRIAEMSHRIRQLEDALQISHGSVSTASHPLLAADLLEVKNGIIASTASKNQTGPGDSESLDSLGTLAVTNRGTESYIGVPDALLLKFGTTYLDPHMEPGLEATLPAPVSYLSKTFPFTPLYLPAQEIQEYIEEKLPSYERASSLVEAYLGNISWFFRPVDREQIMEELIPAVYKRKRQKLSGLSPGSSQTNVSNDEPPANPHVLALLLATFAIGAAADLTLPPWNDEADLYYHLARTTLGLKPVFEGSGLHAVQAIALIGAYDIFACRKVAMDGTWKIMSFSLSLAASIGLNRDPAHFKLSPKLVQRRRRVFWEIYSVDVWKSLATGRPLTFTPAVIDCEFPDDTDAKYAAGDIELPNSIWWFRYRYCKEIMQEVVSSLNTLRSVKYSEILALDQKIREYDPDEMFTLATRNSASQQDDSDLYHYRMAGQLAILKDITLLLLHRIFFARALVEDSSNPIRTRFGPSFLSTYRSSASLVNNARRQFERTGHALMRLWPIWGHALGASVMLGSIAACGTASALAPQAYVQFDLAYEMFSKVPQHPLVKTALPTLTRLREQAQQALMKHGHKIPSRPSFTHPTEAQSSGASNEFNAITSYGKVVTKSFAGDFGTVPRYEGFFYDPALAPSSPSSTLARYPTYLSKENASHPINDETAIAYKSNSKQRSDLEAYGPSIASIPSVEMSSETTQGYEHLTPLSHSRSPRESPEEVQQGAHDFNAPEGPTLMQVDYSPFSSETSTTVPDGDQDLFASSGLSSNADIFNSYTPFPDMAGPSTGLSSGAMSGLPPEQEQAFPTDALFTSSPSNLSPGMFFKSDFDVSFDMRSSSGQENILPMLPSDMEAWRTFLQDSRFFGIYDEIPESEKTTPK